MSLPPQDVLDEIKKLITEITGFQGGDDNFAICERYCLSHVVHHSYPFVNRTTVKDLINSYVSRFHGHGYFKVSRELNHQVESFLSNTSLFEKNSQYDIQWCLLSLVSSLSSNLTSVSQVPDLLPIEFDDSESSDINWHEYLIQDLPQSQAFTTQESLTLSSDNEQEESYDSSKEEVSGKIKEFNPEENQNTTENNGGAQCKEAVTAVKENTMYRNEEAAIKRIIQIQGLIEKRLSATDIENDYKRWGNITEKFEKLLGKEGFPSRSQLISELEMMEYILYQFQTGEKIFLKKGLSNPALISVTQKTLGNYLDSLQPYFQMIKCFKDFNDEIRSARYPELNSSVDFNESGFRKHSNLVTATNSKKYISNVLYVYNLMLNKALDPFQNHILNIIDNLGNYSVIRLQHEVQTYFFELTSLYYVHGLATKNWKNDSNWITSIRVLSVLYEATLNASTTKISFVYLNMFLQCFHVYLNITDSWISSLSLNDPTDEFLVTAFQSTTAGSDSMCSQFLVRPYKSEMEKAGVKAVPFFDYVAEKIVQLAESLEVLGRLKRYANDEKIKSCKSSYRSLVEIVNSKINTLVTKVQSRAPPKAEEKKRSIFTISNFNLILPSDNGKGDGTMTNDKLTDKKPEEDKVKMNSCSDHCTDLVKSTVKNSFFKKAFENVGVEYQRQRLREARSKDQEDDDDNLTLDTIRISPDFKHIVYPYHKIISECCCRVIEDRISFACNLVKRVVITESNLKLHMSLLRSLFLFNDSYLIQWFVLEFYTQPVVWDSSYLLTFHLRECLETRYKELVPSLSISQCSTTFPENALEAIDALTVNYEVKWPLTLIFTPNLMTMYNRVFRLALKLKWAHWMLSNLHFQRGNENKSTRIKSTHHRLQILRFWFLSTLGVLNNYFMAQMSTSIPDFEACDNLKEIITGNDNFIRKIHDNCFLGNKAPEMWSLIFEYLLPLCLDLERSWKSGTVVSDSKLSSMETIFADCHNRLSNLLTVLEKTDRHVASRS